MYLSPTLIKTFESCKLRYKWLYIDKLEKAQPITDETVFGQYLHRFMELYERKETADIVKLLNEELSVPARLENDLITTIGNTTRFLKQYKDLPCENEQKIKSNFNGIALGGKVDKIYKSLDGLIVVDFKTSRRFWKGMNDSQLKFYAFTLSRERGVPVPNIETIIFYSFLNSIDSSTYTEKEINCFANYLEEVSERIEKAAKKSAWSPSKSKLCDYCQYKEDCPAWR